MNRLLRSTIAIACIALLMGCRTAEHSMTLMHHAEDIVIDNPDSALMLVRSIDPGTIRGKHDRAYYRLVYSEALYYNLMEGNSDTLTRPMMEYYLLSDEHSERARALYQHAITTMNGGNNGDAMFALVEAEKSLEQIDNPRLAGLVHRTKGDIYLNELLFTKALESYNLSHDYFADANLLSHRAWSLLDITVIYNKLRLRDKAIETAIKAEILSMELNDNALLSRILINLCYIYVQEGDFESCKLTYEKFTKTENATSWDAYYIIGAILENYQGNISLADQLMSYAKDKDDIHYLYIEQLIEQHRGNYKEALLLLRRNIDRQDQNIFEMIDNVTLNSHVDYLSKKLEATQTIHKHRTQIYILLIIICIIGLMLIMLMTTVKINQKRRYIDELNEHINAVQRDIRQQESKIKLLKSDINSREHTIIQMQRTINDHLSSSLSNIGDLLDAYYSDKTKEVKHNQLIKEVDRYVRDFASNPKGYMAVEKIVNESNDNIMEKLRTEYPDFAEDEYRLLCLIYADFSSNAICMFMGYDKNKLYKTKSRIKGKLNSKKSKNHKLFIMYL